ncbi:VOC family protein [Fodinicola feengrottensis]|uniref:VOC family protein n=1 Tax=Fodinicola feengrottensis TaxID=435914 RepID=A0ABP4TZQ0_9ACTN|nr:VOC family protein [Fodinicola feengrottensis]
MTARIKHVTFDAVDPAKLTAFWSQVSGWQEDPDDPNLPEHTEWGLVSPSGPNLLFVLVPESKTSKNRVHLDLIPDERTRDEEVQWLLGIGASQVADHRKPDGSGWVIMADPEGNEFCVERSDAERKPK